MFTFCVCTKLVVTEVSSLCVGELWQQLNDTEKAAYRHNNIIGKG